MFVEFIKYFNKFSATAANGKWISLQQLCPCPCPCPRLFLPLLQPSPLPPATPSALSVFMAYKYVCARYMANCTYKAFMRAPHTSGNMLGALPRTSPLAALLAHTIPYNKYNNLFFMCCALIAWNAHCLWHLIATLTERGRESGKKIEREEREGKQCAWERQTQMALISSPLLLVLNSFSFFLPHTHFKSICDCCRQMAPATPPSRQLALLLPHIPEVLEKLSNCFDIPSPSTSSDRLAQHRADLRGAFGRVWFILI